MRCRSFFGSGIIGHEYAESANMKIALLLEEGSTSSSVATTLDMFRLAQRFQPEAG